jgi:hypothetical protein
LVRYTAAVIDALPSTAAVVVTADQLSTRLGEEIVILGLRDSVYNGLSDVGARIWDLIQTPRTLEEILNILVAEYEVTADEAGGARPFAAGSRNARPCGDHCPRSRVAHCGDGLCRNRVTAYRAGT